jgi:hypothetical protein
LFVLLGHSVLRTRVGVVGVGGWREFRVYTCVLGSGDGGATMAAG